MDPQFLETLPADQFRQGMAEVIKSAMIGDEVLWKYLESHTESIKKREPESLVRVVSACCILKAKVVQSDEMESGHRRVLNLGHTVGHAIEKLSGYSIHHGDAVAMGLVVAATLAVHMGKIPDGDLQRLKRLCEAWDLPVRLPATFSPDDVVEALKTDKKRVKGTLHFILPVRIGEVVDITNLNLEDLKRVIVGLREL
jgi:3-dehydroquinate synthase